jgi:hypothetical protein
MSIFGSIMSKIFGGGGAEAAPPPADDAKPAGPAAAPDAAPGVAPAEPPPAGTTASAQPAATAPVDVSAVLSAMAAKNPQKLDWQHSIVDLMKLLGLDSSLKARQELAQELHYSGDTKDSAAMNTWLHKQVMAQLAENGGKVPDELRA